MEFCSLVAIISASNGSHSMLSASAELLVFSSLPVYLFVIFLSFFPFYFLSFHCGFLPAYYVIPVAEISCCGVCGIWHDCSYYSDRCSTRAPVICSHDHRLHCSLFHCISTLHLDHIHVISAFIQLHLHARNNGLLDIFSSIYRVICSRCSDKLWSYSDSIGNTVEENSGVIFPSQKH